jgi:hypothetical protein
MASYLRAPPAVAAAAGRAIPRLEPVTGGPDVQNDVTVTRHAQFVS